jgi:Uma2 family endonuclease
MSSVLRPPAIPGRPADEPGRPKIPPLRNGDHLTRAEFHRRYEAMGGNVRAELIEGIVYIWNSPEMPSPVSLNKHGTPHFHVVTWAGYYCSKTPGLLPGDNSTVFIDGVNEPQPDVLLGIPVAAGGRTRLVTRGDNQYVEGPPDLVVEVAASSVAIDLNAKLRAYQRNGVGEYLVVLTEEDREVRWMALVDNRFEPIAPDADGLLKSRLFPGLWLDGPALLAGDLPKVLAAVEKGCLTEAHQEFAARLAAAAPPASA